MVSLRSIAPIFGALAASLLTAAAPAHAADAARPLDEISFGLNWVPEAEQGGFWQAMATGLYEKHGLKVKLHIGGPQENIDLLVATGAIDVAVTSNSFNSLNGVDAETGLVEIAGFHQKEARVLIAHPNVGNDSFEAIRGKPVMLAKSGVETFWKFLKARYDYTDTQIRPYSFTLAPFLSNTAAIQQGVLTAEPFMLRKEGVDPVVLLLADAGYLSYGEPLESTWKLVKEKPDLLQRFVDASIEGWYAFTYGDPAPAFKAILAANPEMTQEQCEFTRDEMIKHEIIDSGDSLTLGIGAMTDERWHGFFEEMVKAGVYKPTMDYKKAYTLQFVNKKVGLASRR